MDTPLSATRLYFQRLYQFWFPNGWSSVAWLLFAAVPLYFFQTVIHEGSHSLASAFSGNGFVKFAPFPHFNTSFGSFLNGVAFTNGNGFVAMPQIMALLLIVGFSAIAIWAPIRNPTGRFFVRSLYLAFCVDLGYATIKGLGAGSSANSDWGKFTDDIGAAGSTVLAWLFWALMLSHFVWVQFSVWHDHDAPTRRFWDYFVVSVVLMATSILAIIVFAAVSDPTIDKSHGSFIAVLTLHIALVVWGVVYLALAGTRDARA